MGRPPVKIMLDPATRVEFERVYKASPCNKDREKAQAVLLASDGTRSCAEIARIVGRNRGTIVNWFKALADGNGTPGSLFGHAPQPGRPSKMHDEAVRR